MNRIVLILLSLFLFQCSTTKVVPEEQPAQVLQEVKVIVETAPKDIMDQAPPKLIIGIIVDQMRYDYLYKFAEKYGEGGFKRLMKDGFHLRNVHFNYIPTFTAVGHTSVYAGTTPSNHGIISNHWYDKFKKEKIYCVDDDRYQTIGSTSDQGQKSPYRHQATSITDELKLASNMQSKVIGIGIKDRSAILPTGHTANGAYWYEGGNTGKWISSSYYNATLPSWVEQFNNSKANQSEALVSQPWETLYDINTYTESISDNNPYERAFDEEKSPTFPHDFPALRKDNKNFDLIKWSPAGNTITTDFAIAALEKEKLGQGSTTDFLALSYSSTDYVGHQFGVASKEIEDTYLRLDLDIERLLKHLDATIGHGQYTVFLTSDHGAVHVPDYLRANNLPGKVFDKKKFLTHLDQICLEHFNADNLIENYSSFQIFLNKDRIHALKLDFQEVVQTIADRIIDFDGIYRVVTGKTLQQTQFDRGPIAALQNGYNQKFSGDILIVHPPGGVPYGGVGSTHGTSNNYDTHAPLIFYGNGIRNGASGKRYEVIDIAPTISTLLNISFPSACTGNPIMEVLKQ